MRALLRNDDLPGAQSRLEKAIQSSPNSAELIETRGELRFRQGEISAAQEDFRKAIGLNDTLARAYWGLARVYRAVSYHKKAQLFFFQAHTLDPHDSDIYRSWVGVLKRPQRIVEIQKILESPAPDADKEEVERTRSELAWEKEREGKKLFRLASEYVPAQVPFAALLHDVQHVRAFALPVSINGNKPVKLEIDTGASGILITSKIAERLGLQKLHEMKIGGIGDEGLRDAYATLADTVRVGPVEFADCVVEVSDKKNLVEVDGLIGMDVFSRFLVTLDFPKRVLKLAPLPNYKDDGEPRDRTITPDLNGFFPILRFGHALLISTQVSDTAPVLFLIDTGSGQTLIARDMARRVTKVHNESYVRMKGISGKVKDVSTTGELVLQFAGFRQKSLDMTSFDFGSLSKSIGTEVSGVLGLPLLNLFELTIDYRDGMVKFVYPNPR